MDSKIKQTSLFEVDVAHSSPVLPSSVMMAPFASVPMHVARSGMFSATTGYVAEDTIPIRDMECYRDENIRVSFTGHILNQDDADVLMVVNYMIKSSNLSKGDHLKMFRATLLHELGWSANGENYARLLECMKRLTESMYYLESPDENSSFNKKSVPLRMFMYKQDGQYLEIWIPEESSALYKDNAILNWQKRKLLNSKSNLPRAIQFYMSGFPEKKEFRVEITKIKTIARSISPNSKFVVSLKRGLEDLEKANIIQEGSWWVKKEYGLWWCGWTVAE